MRRHLDAKLLFPAVMLVLAGLIRLSISSPIIAIGAIGAVTYSIILAKAGLWRTMVGTSILISVLRSGPPSSLLGEGAWYALQFAPILIAWLALLSNKPDQVRRSDRNVILCLALFAVAALATNLTSLAPSSTLPQSLLLAGMSGFLAFTYTRRWTSEDLLRGDVTMVFVLVTAIQLAGVAAIFVGQSWPFDPDYGRYRGLFSNANYAGMMSAIGIAVGLYLLRVSRRGRPAIVMSVAVLAVGLLMSGSRGALVALGIGIVVLMLSRSGRKVVIPLVSLVGVGLIFAALIYPQIFDALDKFFLRDSASPDVTSGRLDIYAGMLRLFQLTPFTGTGFRTVEVLSPASSGLAGHNIYLTVLTETGLFGAFLFVGLVFAIVVASRAGKTGRPLLLVVVTVAAAELTESSIYGWGGPTAISAWLLILAFAANGRFLKDKPPFVDGLVPNESPSEIVPKRLLASSLG
ncbi:O-antigen ligase family protein [Arthrobacter bambusae]|uniref:O-antigen ligase n=1 Tax=Arthrobacter bambusae TaxID=1338426 RepID=A0AAW8D6W0_9MICC|nr:O-antigen ligase family protein [Arthrobacter bambusae]MDP9904646.1 O-antigen ligase [Arthrobacter bambusae]MDQ0129462.1 O-antigen ligase [Arthrobacter bambusae]MDQ0180925.1 O-antigen ligase [Arthrobacter bambusae]